MHWVQSVQAFVCGPHQDSDPRDGAEYRWPYPTVFAALLCSPEAGRSDFNGKCDQQPAAIVNERFVPDPPEKAGRFVKRQESRDRHRKSSNEYQAEPERIAPSVHGAARYRGSGLFTRGFVKMQVARSC